MGVLIPVRPSKPDGSVDDITSIGPIDKAKRFTLRKLRPDKLLKVLSTLSFVLALFLIINVVIYETGERYENTKKDYYFFEAVPVGTDSTLVLYEDHSYITDHFYTLTVLDKDGRYEVPPSDLLRTVSDFVPSIGYDGWYLGTSSQVLPTKDEPVVLSFQDRLGKNIDLECLRFDQVRGDFKGAVEVMGEVPMFWYKFDAATSGSNVNVLFWNHSYSSLSVPGPNLFHVRSRDGGRTWDPPYLLLPGPWHTKYGQIFTRDDIVTIYLNGATNSTGYWPNGQDLILRSVDGGSSWERPIPCTGDVLPAEPDVIHGTIDDDGNVFMIVEKESRNQGDVSIFRISPLGEVTSLPLPEELNRLDLTGSRSQTPTQPLFFDDAETGERLFFVYTRGYRSSSHHIIRLDGTVVKSFMVPNDEEGLGILMPTRYDGRFIYGIGVEDFYIGRGSVRLTNEIRLLRMDVETGSMRVQGMPYRVVDRHTEEEEKAFKDRSAFLIDLLVLSLTSIVVLLFISRRQRTFEEPHPKETGRVDLVFRLAIFGVFLYFIFIFLSSKTLISKDLIPLLVIIGYFMVAVITTEGVARNLKGFKKARVLHLVTVSSFMLIFIAYANNYMGDFEIEFFFWSSIFILWIGTVILTLLLIRRLIKEIRENKKGVTSLMISLLSLALVLPMPYVIINSIEIYL
jgi:hypothetical protein